MQASAVRYASDMLQNSGPGSIAIAVFMEIRRSPDA